MKKERKLYYWIKTHLICTGSILVIGCLLIPLITFAICYFVSLDDQKLQKEEGYSEKSYEYLNKIADNIINEDVGINVALIPLDITEYEITYKNEEIVFRYQLDNRGREWSTPASMEIKLSENFEILKREPNFHSQEEYVHAYIVKLYGGFMILGLIVDLLFWIICWIIWLKCDLI